DAGTFEKPQPAAAVAVLGCAQEMGVETVDTWASLAEIHTKDQARFRSLYIVKESRWAHMSADGNRLVATAIAHQLQATEPGAASRR
ncbi:MAG TPA: hypothetical protein VN808_18845, partial [Stellaceae bacterium]|nr:hypothetical protein [Stellaceae bacterium]